MMLLIWESVCLFDERYLLHAGIMQARHYAVVLYM